MTENHLKLAHNFLVATPGLEGTPFKRAVAYLCEHDQKGALGLVINNPMNIMLPDVLAQMNITSINNRLNDIKVLEGGPVHKERGFVMHPKQEQKSSAHWRISFETPDGIIVTTSKDILEALAHGDGPDNIIFTLGYAGWGPGQLEQEIAQGKWLLVPVDAEILFNTPYELRWSKALSSLGINESSLVGYSGNA